MAQQALMKKCTVYLYFIIGYSFSVFYGLCFLYRILKQWVKNPTNHFWEVKNREIPPACLNDPALGTHAYIQIKNVKLHYVEKGDRSKPLMLCIHGYPEFWYSWRHQLKEFSNDYWVVAVDMRGYGDSEKPVGSEYYTIKLLVADIKNLVTALGKEKCTLVAHDWGGLLAWYFALEEPQAVDSYIIMNSTHPKAFSKVVRNNRDQFFKSWYIYFYQLPYLPELMGKMNDMALIDRIFKSEKSPSSVTEEDIEAYKFTFGKPGAFTFPINYYRANFLLRHEVPLKDQGKADDFPPGLILFGEEDRFICREIQEESAKMAANTKLVYIKGANHFVQQDDPEGVNKAMRTFFTEIKQKK